MPACQDMSQEAEELNWVVTSQLAVAEEWQEWNQAVQRRLHV
jgi:hypothetical protein